MNSNTNTTGTSFFSGLTNLKDVRDMYKELCFRHHPDVSGYDSTEIMKQINIEYQRASEALAANEKFTDSELAFNKLFQEKINALINIRNITIELIGNWLWITGETKENKELLKSLEFSYAPIKKAWFFKSYSYKKKNGEQSNFDQMRFMFGSKIINNNTDNKTTNIILI